jgi:hypothetical protein
MHNDIKRGITMHELSSLKRIKTVPSRAELRSGTIRSSGRHCVNMKAFGFRRLMPPLNSRRYVNNEKRENLIPAI